MYFEDQLEVAADTEVESSREPDPLVGRPDAQAVLDVSEVELPGEERQEVLPLQVLDPLERGLVREELPHLGVRRVEVLSTISVVCFSANGRNLAMRSRSASVIWKNCRRLRNSASSSFRIAMYFRWSRSDSSSLTMPGI